jgi:hypothetical protein
VERKEKKWPHPRGSFTESRRKTGAERHFLQSSMQRKQSLITPPWCVHFWKQLMASMASSIASDSKFFLSDIQPWVHNG